MQLSTVLFIVALAVAAPESTTTPAPLLLASNTSNALANKYTVKFKNGSGYFQVQDALKSLDINPKYTFRTLFQGFAAELNETTLERLQMHPDVEYIEQDSMARAADVAINNIVRQNNAPWGLARVSSKKTGGTTYTYDASAGEGTCAYVIDTGVQDSHPEFQGRAKQLKSFIVGETTDEHGHGTHCAGTICSKTYGVAKKTRIYGVKVLDNAQSWGAWSGIIAGMEFVAEDSKTRSCPKGVFVNLSIVGDKTTSVNDATTKLSDSGIFVGVAAGNNNVDVDNSSPGSADRICTVGATDKSDNRSSFSNYGMLVEVFGPGTEVLSTYLNGSVKIMSGTSMATPHIVGIAAYYAAKNCGTGQQLCKMIQITANKGVIKNAGTGSPNLLTYNGAA